MKTAGLRLKRLREKRGLTVEQLVREVKSTDNPLLIDVVLVMCWESGNECLDDEFLLKLAKYFNVKVKYLLGL